MIILRFLLLPLLACIQWLFADLILFLYYSRKARYDCSRCKMWSCDGTSEYCSKRRK